jgi:hypothetical protein
VTEDKATAFAFSASPPSAGTRARSRWNLALLTLTSLGVLLGSWALLIHTHYRQQMEAIAAIERLGGSVGCRNDAPQWLLRLQPDSALWRLEGLGPNWLREWLPAEALVDHLQVIEDVWLDEGPGVHPVTNVSGQRRDVHPIVATDEDLAQIGKFTHLECLYLRHMRVSDAGVIHLRNLREMRHLYLSFTDVGDESMDVFAGFEKLEMLRLVGTQVTDAGIAKLANLKHLEELDVRQTGVTASGLDPFRGRPGLKTYGDGPDDPHPGMLSTY